MLLVRSIACTTLDRLISRSFDLESIADAVLYYGSGRALPARDHSLRSHHGQQ